MKLPVSRRVRLSRLQRQHFRKVQEHTAGLFHTVNWLVEEITAEENCLKCEMQQNLA
jgi:hypothetical protein